MNRSDIPTNPSHRWEWIKYQLRTKGTSLAKLARELEVSDTAVKNVKRSPYPRMERAIAKALGLTPVDIWPERWQTSSTPIRQRPNRSETLVQYHYTEGESSNSGVKPHRKTGTEG